MRTRLYALLKGKRDISLIRKQSECKDAVAEFDTFDYATEFKQE